MFAHSVHPYVYVFVPHLGVFWHKFHGMGVCFVLVAQKTPKRLFPIKVMCNKIKQKQQLQKQLVRSYKLMRADLKLIHKWAV